MKNIVIISILMFLTSSFTTSKRVEALIKKEIKAVFKIENYEKYPVNISNELKKSLPLKISETNFFTIENSTNFLGYYYLGKAYGKADYFDFIVIFDADLMIAKVKILVYREDHGGEIGSKRWLKQFVGKTSKKKLIYQKDIAAISGATISAKSMTNEVNKLLKTIQILNSKKQL